MMWQKPSLKRILKHSVLGSLALVLIGLALLTSNVTVRFAAMMAMSLTEGLQIEQIDGDLIHGVRIKTIAYHNEILQFQANDTEVQWEPLCLPKLCVPAVSAARVDMTVGTAPDASPAPQVVQAPSKDSQAPATTSAALDTPAHPFEIPLPAWLDVQITRLSVAELKVQSPDATLSIQQLQSGARLRPNQLELAPSSLHQLALDTHAATPSPSKTDIAAQIQTGLQLWPQWQAQIPALTIENLDVDNIHLRQVSLASQLTPDVFTIRELALRQADYHASLTATLQRDANWQGGLHVTTSTTSKPLEVQLQWQGPLHNTTLTGDVSLVQFAASQELAISSHSQLHAQLNLLERQPQFEVNLQTPKVTLAHIASRLPAPVPSSQQRQTKDPVTQLAKSAEQSTAFFPATPEQFNLDETHRQGEFLDVSLQLKGSLEQLEVALQGRSQWPQLPNAELQLAGTWRDQQFNVRQLTVDALNGQLKFAGKVSAEQLQGKLQIDKLQPGLYWTDFPGEFSGSTELRLSYAKQLDVHLSRQHWLGQIRNLPMDIEGDIHLWFRDYWRLQSDGIALTHGRNQLRFTGRLDQDWQLSAQADIPDLSLSFPWAEGRVNAEVLIGGPYLSPNLQFTVDSQELSWGDDFALTSGHFSGLVRQFGDLSSQLNLSIKGLASPQLQVRELQWQTEGTLAEHQSKLTINSPQLKATTTFNARWKQGVWNGQFAQMELDSDLGHWVLEPTLTLQIDWLKQQLQLSDSCFTEQSSRVCISTNGWLSTQQGVVRLHGDDVALKNFDWLLPGQFGLAGTASGDASVTWKQGKLQQATWNVDARNGQFRYQGYSPIEMAWQHSQLNGELDRQRLTTTLHTQINEQQLASVVLELSQFAGKSPQLNATVHAQQVDLRFLQPLFNEYSKFAGALHADLKLSGLASQPDVQGELRLADLAMTGSVAPIELKPSSILVRFFGKQAELAADLRTAEGPIDWTGKANWINADAWSAQSAIRAELLKLQTSYGDMELQPDLQFFANSQGGSATGRLTIPKGQFQFNDLPEDAIRISADEVMVETASGEEKSPWAFNSDIRLVLGDQVKFAAFGLKTRLQGELRVRQANNQPTIHGQVNLKDGVFRAYGQDLQLTKGRLTFNGLPQQPLLNIEAIRNKEKTEDNVIAGIRVNGTADDPTVEVFSKPSKPQANALAYLLLGRDLGSSKGDGAMTTGLIGLGIASSGKLVGKLGEAFGVSDLALDTSGTGDASKVTVSGYLSPKLQVKYGVGIFNQFGEFTLRYRLFKQLYLEAIRGIDSSVDLLYKVEFD